MSHGVSNTKTALAHDDYVPITRVTIYRKGSQRAHESRFWVGPRALWKQYASRSFGRGFEVEVHTGLVKLELDKVATAPYTDKDTNDDH